MLERRVFKLQANCTASENMRNKWGLLTFELSANLEMMAVDRVIHLWLDGRINATSIINRRVETRLCSDDSIIMYLI